jgi:hypothetical protein
MAANSSGQPVLGPRMRPSLKEGEEEECGDLRGFRLGGGGLELGS